MYSTIRQPKNNNNSFETLPNILQKLKEIILAVGQIQKIYYTDKEMDNIWNISADDVEQQQQICYMNPCIAQSLYAISKIKEKYKAEGTSLEKKSLSLGIEFLSYATTNQHSLHFFIEQKEDNDICIIDFSHDNYVFLYQGPYKHRNWKHPIISHGTATIPVSDIQNSDTIFTLLDNHPEIAQQFHISKEQITQLFTAHTEKLKKDNTPAEREEFNKKRNTPLKVIDGTFRIEDIQHYLGEALLPFQNLQINPITMENSEIYKIELHALLCKEPTTENQQKMCEYLFL